MNQCINQLRRQHRVRGAKLSRAEGIMKRIAKMPTREHFQGAISRSQFHELYKEVENIISEAQSYLKDNGLIKEEEQNETD